MCKVCQYGNHKNSTAVDSWQMVVMDGTMGVFKVVLNTKMSQDIPHEDWHAGVTILIQPGDFKFIFIQDDEKSGCSRGVLFIDNCDWVPAPNDKSSEAEDHSSTVTPEHCMVWLDSDCVKRVMKDSVIIFNKSYQHEEGFFFYMALSPDKMRKGDFISNKQKKLEWNKKKRLASNPCCCRNSPFYFQSCILHSHPLQDCDMEEIFHSEVKGKLKGRVCSDTFDGLSSSHKRWCYYWYYAVNFFHLGGGDAEVLPKDCFVKAVRSIHPDPAGKYTGHKSSEERRSAVES